MVCLLTGWLALTASRPSTLVVPVWPPVGIARAELRRVRPDLPVVLMTGYSEHDLADLEFGPTLHFLQKPFRPSDLTACARRLLAG